MSECKLHATSSSNVFLPVDSLLQFVWNFSFENLKIQLLVVENKNQIIIECQGVEIGDFFEFCPLTAKWERKRTKLVNIRLYPKNLFYSQRLTHWIMSYDNEFDLSSLTVRVTHFRTLSPVSTDLPWMQKPQKRQTCKSQWKIAWVIVLDHLAWKTRWKSSDTRSVKRFSNPFPLSTFLKKEFKTDDSNWEVPTNIVLRNAISHKN